MGFRKVGDAGRFTRRDKQRAAARQRWLWVEPSSSDWRAFCFSLSLAHHTMTEVRSFHRIRNGQEEIVRAHVRGARHQGVKSCTYYKQTISSDAVAAAVEVHTGGADDAEEPDSRGTLHTGTVHSSARELCLLCSFRSHLFAIRSGDFVALGARVRLSCSRRLNNEIMKLKECIAKFGPKARRCEQHSTARAVAAGGVG